jgi:hypothetical protein
MHWGQGNRGEWLAEGIEMAKRGAEDSGPAATISEGLDFDGPDRVDDALYNQILWSMMKG